jgi:GNAT superfamily N-acetyltransferase
VISGENGATACSETKRGGPVLAIRARTGDDLDECVTILADVHRRDGYPTRWPDDPAGWLNSPGLTGAWVATLEGTLVGHVGLATAGPNAAAAKLFGAPATMVTRLFVAATARGHGAARALLAQAVLAAHERGLHPILDVDSTSAAAIALYEGLGWRFLGTSEAQWGSRQVTVRSYAAPRDTATRDTATRDTAPRDAGPRTSPC